MTWKCFIASLLIGAVVGHYVPQSQMTVQQQLFLESVEQECTKFYGNLSNSEYFNRTYSSFVECVLKNMDQAIVRDLQTTDPNKMPETAVTFVQNFCLKKDDLSKCFDSLVDAMGPCTDPKVNANKHKVIMTNTVNYVCDNNTQNFKGAVVGHYVPQSQTMVQHQMFLESLGQECTKYGNISNSEYFHRAYGSFVQCVVKNLNQTFVRDLQTSDPNITPETAVTFVQNFCLTKDEFSKCFNSLVDAMAPCTDPKYDANKNKVIMRNMVNYVCDNNTQNFKEFIDDGAISCFNEKHDLFWQCSKNIDLNGLLPIVRRGSGDMAVEKDQETNEIELEKEVKEACAKVNGIASCVQTTLSQCPKPTTAKFTSRIINFLIEGSPCDSNEVSLH